MARARTADVLRIGFAVAAVAVLSSRAAAQRDESLKDVDSPGLAIEAAAGWDGIVDPSGPVPLSFLIRNHSERIIEGELRIEDPLNGREAVLGDVIVAPGTARRLTSIQALTDWYECFATLSSGSDVLWRRELPLTGNGFRADVNYALVIDDGGRALRLPGEVSTTSEAATSADAASEAEGRPIDCLTVKTWQMPIHPGPLVAAQAIVLPEGTRNDSLNDAQLRAIAEWMCQGGVLFLHEESANVLEHLIGLSPLDAGAAVTSGGFMVRRVGLGAIHQYSQPLFRSENAEVRARISDVIAGLTKNHISSLVTSVHLYNRGGRRADVNRLLVVGFFLCYAFFSGFVSLLLFRATQRRMGVYLAVVVAGACVLSGLLGGYLRFSQGDLYSVTVTQAGTGGAVQAGQIEVQSAGGRNTRVAVKGESADLQFVEEDPRSYAWYRWDQSRTGSPPFTWQPNLATSAEDTYQVNVTMTPWGRRRLHATAFQRGMRPLEIRLEFEPRGAPVNVESEGGVTATVPTGVFTLKVINHLPFDLAECWLVIGAGRPFSGQGILVFSGRGVGPQRIASGDAGQIRIHQRYPLHGIPAGAVRHETFEAAFTLAQNEWEQMIPLPGGSLSLPRLENAHGASAWIIGRIEESPILRIDESRSDFVPEEHLHFYMQEILPEEMPDASVFPGRWTDQSE